MQKENISFAFKIVLLFTLLTSTLLLQSTPLTLADERPKSSITSSSTAKSSALLTDMIPPKWTVPLPAKGCPDSTNNCHFSSPALADINGDGFLDVVAATNNGYVVVVKHNGQVLWDTGTSSYFGVSNNQQEIAASPAVGDIDKDGFPEIVVAAGTNDTQTCEPGGVIVLSHTGSVEPGWPKLMVDENQNGCGDGVFATPALADLTNDGFLEITVGSFDKRIYAWRYNGSSLPGFPPDSSLYPRFGWDNLRNRLADTIWSSPAVADITGDGNLNILIGSDEGNFDNSWPNGTGWVCPYATPPGAATGYCGGTLVGLDVNGNHLPGFPKYILEHIQSTPAVSDVDRDGSPEIFVGTGTYYNLRSPDNPTSGFRVYGWDQNGNSLPGWGGGKVTGGPMPASPVIGDITGDSQAEILITSMDKKLYAWHLNGTPVSGFPMTPVDQSGKAWGYNVGRSLVLADYDADGKMEIFLATAWTITIIDGNGNILTSTNFPNDTKPMYYAEGTLANNPAIGDLDNDGKLELVAFNSKLYVWELPNNSTDADWPMFKHNAARTGYPVQPAISGDTAVAAMHAASDSSNVKLTFTLNGSGTEAYNWTSTTPAGVTLSPSSGQLPGSVEVTATVARDALSMGKNTFTVTIRATSGGQPVIASPMNVTITVILANNVYDRYLPIAVR